jgi:RNA polymerase sigma-70 factor (ECF subfamily)
MTGQDRDLQLVRRLQAGDRDALGELYDRHVPLMYGTALRILRNASDAEDVIQEAWVQVWNQADRFDATRGTVASYLVTIARTRALDRYRSLASRRRGQSNLEASPPAAPSDPRADVARIGVRERIATALAALDPKQRQVLEIAYFEGLSQSEIADRLKAPLGTVKFWTREGLAKLREALGPQEEWA